MVRPNRLKRELVRARRTARAPVDAAEDVWDRFVAWFNERGWSENTILLAFAVLIGVAGALGVVAFYKLIDIAFALFYRLPAERIPSFEQALYRPVLTAAGLALAWWVMRRIGRGHEGLNVPDVQLAVARRGGDIPTRPALARTAASAITMGGGGSAGSEGPVAVLGSALGAWLGRGFRFGPSRVKVLVGAGAAAGISAAFNAPLAGAFFALEEILGSFAVTAFPPVVVSSVVAAIVSRSFFGNHPAFPIPEEYGYSHALEILVFFPLLGVLAGLIAVLFIRTYFGTETFIRKLRLPPAAVPWIGGAFVGSIVLLSNGELVGSGHLAISLEMFGRQPWYLLALLALGKIAVTSVTLNAGGSGGVFTPSLYIGAVAGGALGVALADLLPGLSITPEAYALVGMGALVAAATEAPITGILIVFEMTNDYAIVLPLMLATVIATVIARRLEPDSLYSGWLRRRGETIAHGTDPDVLAGLCVADALDTTAPVIHENASVRELLVHLGAVAHTEFAVIDDEQRLVGMITIGDIGRAAHDHANLAPLLVAADLATPTDAVEPNDSLLEAVRRLGLRGRAAIPVVEPGTDRLLGITSRARILALYEQAVARQSDWGDAEARPERP